MPSPFPGMNPYLEQPDAWPTFHSNFIGEIQRQLTPVLPEGYFSKVEVSMFLHEPSATDRRYLGRADVAVGEDRDNRHDSTETTTVVRPRAWRAVLPGAVEERHHSLEIRDKQDRRLVTVIEHLSPTNKRGGGNYGEYLRKRQRLPAEGVNLVEIDLLRGGGRMPMVEPPPGDYCVMVARAADAPDVDAFPFNLRDPMPAVPVPLRPNTPDAQVDLTAALRAVYEERGYAAWLYDGGLAEVSPRLSPQDAEWAAGLAAAG